MSDSCHPAFFIVGGRGADTPKMRLLDRLGRLLSRVRVGADPRKCSPGTIVLAPRGGVVLRCGIAALVEVAAGDGEADPAREEAEALVGFIVAAGLDAVTPDGDVTDASRARYLGGDERLDHLTRWARGLKRSAVFAELVRDQTLQGTVREMATSLRALADHEERRLAAAGAAVSEADLEAFTARVLRVRDAAWHVEREALAMADEITGLVAGVEATPKLIEELRRLLAVLRCIDRIEIRGRDSAGVALQVVFTDPTWFDAYLAQIEERGLSGELRERTHRADLPAGSIAVSAPDAQRPTLTFLYKVAAEVGRLGDNGAELRRQVAADPLLRATLSQPGTRIAVLGHTRWASSGVISVPNCHPVDNGTRTQDDSDGHRAGRVFVVMNGDVDNHLELRAEYERETGRAVSPRVTTDTKVVALEIERHLVAGRSPSEAFRRACARFQGSCAIGMLTDLAPGRLFLSLRGSGQSLYVGVAPDGFFASSEVYGLVEETGRYIKMDGETERVAGDAASAGQVVEVSLDGPRGAAGMHRSCFDGTELPVGDEDVRQAEITTRDVDRGDFQHFFRKEITQASRSVSRTLLGRVTYGDDGAPRLATGILSRLVSERLESARLRHVYVVGQGTAAVAGAGIAEFVRRVVGSGRIRVDALPATELSGFHLVDDMNDTIVIAVTQSGSTADTNRAVDMARKRGALVVAIVNRRNSDITYRADCVVYTSDGRDVEMSVASTKAFYAQIVAGGLLSLAMARALGTLDAREIAAELQELIALPDRMQQVLDDEDSIRAAAEKYAPTREHWAVVASGPNHVAAREVRIKLSELCYKSIAVDTVEDKKHIDLSSEPMTIVLAAGNPESVLNDVIKDVAIFRAHTGLPIVFCSEGEDRFDPYASAVVHLPAGPPLTSMVLCALAGHLFGYHAARAIDANARFLAGVRSTLVEALEDVDARDDLPERLEPAKREFLELLQRNRFTSSLHPVTSVRIAMLFDRLTGSAVTSASDGALIDNTGGDLVATFVNVLGDALDQTARPIDAIKHQAKIVTVGTSRPEHEVPVVVSRALREASVAVDTLSAVDQLELHRLGPAVAAIEGLTIYELDGLRADGTPGPATRIRLSSRHGIAANLSSRLEDWGPLVGTKRHVTSERRLEVGVGRGDGRRIAILPLLGAGVGPRGLALLHLRFADALSVADKERVLGARLRELRDLVAEANRTFDAGMLDALTPEQIVLETPLQLAERILA